MYRLLLTVILIVLSACSTTTPQATPTVVDSSNASSQGYPVITPNVPNTSSVYPVPNAEPIMSASPYPVLEATVSASTPEPTPPIVVDSTKGAIRGVLLDTEGKPIAQLFVFLATITDNTTGPVISFSLDSQKGATDNQGNFVIRDVPAGVYSLAIWTPATNFLIPAPNGEPGSAIRVEVRNGEITELGQIRIRRP
ncbi:carboxypeptidase-like regulatory domain-containing protein [Chloroflexus sp.]